MFIFHSLHGFLHTLTGGLDCILIVIAALPYFIWKKVKGGKFGCECNFCDEDEKKELVNKKKTKKRKK